MCRFLIYKGEKEALMADLITRPTHSLVRQSYEHFLPRLGGTRESVQARNVHLNGDGVGIGWYSSKKPEPCVFTSITPAWHNKNLQRLAEHICSTCIFSHIRAATPGSVISEVNCHPFQYGRILFMHNGCVAFFSKVKRKMHSLLSDSVFQMIQGTTDSETLGALFVENLPDKNPFVEHSAEELKDALFKTIRMITLLCEDYRVQHQKEEQPSSLNIAVSNGNVVIATRFRNHVQEDPPSLYISTCSLYELKKELQSPMKQHAQGQEPSTQEVKAVTPEKTVKPASAPSPSLKKKASSIVLKRSTVQRNIKTTDHNHHHHSHFEHPHSPTSSPVSAARTPNHSPFKTPSSPSTDLYSTVKTISAELQESGVDLSQYNEFASVIISSEPLTFVEADWQPLPANHFVMVSKDNEVEIGEIDLSGMIFYNTTAKVALGHGVAAESDGSLDHSKAPAAPTTPVASPKKNLVLKIPDMSPEAPIKITPRKSAPSPVAVATTHTSSSSPLILVLAIVVAILSCIIASQHLRLVR